MLRRAMQRGLRTYLHAFVGVALAGCATTGAHAIIKDLAVDPCYDPIGQGRVLIWSSEPEMASALEDWAKRHGLIVVNRVDGREPVWDRQRQVTIPADEVLRNLAKSHGAQRILVAAAEKNAHPLSYRYAGYSEGPPWLTTVYDPTITIRSLDGSGPTVYWTVIAHGSAPTFSWGRGLGEVVEASLQQVERRAEANAHKKENCSVRQLEQ
jgi:hypothetical protein